jgi:DNA-binding MarR family transcriptional regulator
MRTFGCSRLRPGGTKCLKKKVPLGTFSLQRSEIFASRDSTLRSYGAKEARPLPVNEIGKKILLTSGSITVAIDRLEKRRLVERRAHGTDRRARIVHLTREGKKVITRIYAAHAADMEKLAAASLTKAERKTLISLLKKIGYQAAAQREEDAG